MKKKILIWWSAGITSAVAAKIAIEKYGAENCIIVYIHIDSAHEDNWRFLKDCEKWYGTKIEVWQSKEYKDQFEVIEKTGYVNGPDGARCTKELKKEIRYNVEKYYTANLFNDIQWTNQVFGFEYDQKEINRAIRFAEQYPVSPIYPLIESGLDKNQCAGILISAGIEIPVMYKMGYDNNNCIGCLKGGKGYWNKIRVDFPSIFNTAKKKERLVGHSCIKGVFLDELNPNEGRDAKTVMPECGIFCQVDFADLPSKYLVKILKGEMTISEVVSKVAA